ncbi:hypothetical protein I546_0163 [Mycobacterium kansasii 732]|uniref:Uncharacterized protein n=1 Tax=Mycobacterium kansasii TaxID=1768 RepID=A0A1V3XE90_MYCKA|nr:hypothetical protein I547_1150 [Mycobacterium kansasii 824]EUA15038.1 hypothetical protein I546_0163 [Mycobacterium kansasii 732]OOK67364.1 hypothetical protein BZL30_7600 [Mycobacterium kansasii]OOK77418.1 hypothetical protein BZL29_3008 [Mycobacterium kansasii]
MASSILREMTDLPHVPDVSRTFGKSDWGGADLFVRTW